MSFVMLINNGYFFLDDGPYGSDCLKGEFWKGLKAHFGKGRHVSAHCLIWRECISKRAATRLALQSHITGYMQLFPSYQHKICMNAVYQSTSFIICCKDKTCSDCTYCILLYKADHVQYLPPTPCQCGYLFLK